MQEENNTTPPEVGHPTTAATQPNNSHVDASHSLAWERETLERLVMAQLVEQRTARRWRIGFRCSGPCFLWEGCGIRFTMAKVLSTTHTRARIQR